MERNYIHYCLENYPQHFFNILYQNDDIFKENETLNFLPSINFVEIWKDEDISDKTRETIWKYLQLILFSVSKNVRFTRIIWRYSKII